MATGKGVLAADDSIGTMNSRLEGAGVSPTAAQRGAHRALLLTTPDLSDGVGGVILCDETLRQSLSDGRRFPAATLEAGLLAGIKVDIGSEFTQTLVMRSKSGAVRMIDTIHSWTSYVRSPPSTSAGSAEVSFRA